MRPYLRSVLVCLAVVICVPCVGAEDKVFFGNLHSHTSFSDGSGTPAQAYKRARDKAKLDFMAITEHNHAEAESGIDDDDPRKDGLLIANNHALYNGTSPSSLISTAKNFTENGKFIALYGQEFSSIGKGNHVNVFDVNDVIDVPNGKYNELIDDWLPTHKDSANKPAIVQFNHPSRKPSVMKKEYGRDDFGNDANWIKKVGAFAHLMEILNGPALSPVNGQRPNEEYEDEYKKFLNLGFHVGPTADQDNHFFTWGTITDARTGVIADELTKPKILDALRARHVYATEDKNLKIIVKVNGHLCGDRISPPPAANTELDISVSISDKNEPDVDYEVHVFADTIGGDAVATEVIPEVELEGDTANKKITGVKYTGGKQYFYFKIVQTNENGTEDRAWTAPVWFEP